MNMPRRHWKPSEGELRTVCRGRGCSRILRYDVGQKCWRHIEPLRTGRYRWLDDPHPPDPVISRKHRRLA